MTMSFRWVSKSATLNGVLWGTLRKSGWRCRRDRYHNLLMSFLSFCQINQWVCSVSSLLLLCVEAMASSCFAQIFAG